MSCAFFESAARTAVTQVGCTGVGEVFCSFSTCAARDKCPYLGILLQWREVRANWLLVLAWCLGLGAALSGQTSSATTTVDLQMAEETVEVLRPLVQNGSLPPQRLADAEMNLEDAQDNLILQRTLYDVSRATTMTEPEAKRAVEAAERRAERQKKRIARLEELVKEGILARNELTVAQEELASREQIVGFANKQLELVQRMQALMVLERQAIESSKFEVKPLVERFDGNGRFNITDFRALDQQFVKEFGVGLPVSAFGQTATHDALGFDHRGRVDIGLLPDSPQGKWLLERLRLFKIPFYAIRSALPGVSTAPHIHIGPPSTRLHLGN